MTRRYKERRHRRYRREDTHRVGRGLTSAFRTTRSRIMVFAFVILIIILLALWGNSRARSNTSTGLPAEINVSEAYVKYQNGAFVLGVCTPEEWNEFHAPNSTLIPLGQPLAKGTGYPAQCGVSTGHRYEGWIERVARQWVSG